MKNPGKLIEHRDGRKGIAYQADQIQSLLDQDKVVCRFFEDNDMKKGLKEQKVSVNAYQLKVKGFVD